MVKGLDGFLVVEKHPTNYSPANPRYRGIYRIPPFSMKAYEGGFDDPYLFAQNRGTWLLPSAREAREYIEKYRSMYGPEQLEIIFAHTEGRTPPSDVDFIGVDLADLNPPFYSVVGDPPVGAEIHDAIAKVNVNGLFANVDDGLEYFRRVKAYLPQDAPTPAIWMIYRVHE